MAICQKNTFRGRIIWHFTLSAWQFAKIPPLLSETDDISPPQRGHLPKEHLLSTIMVTFRESDSQFSAKNSTKPASPNAKIAAAMKKLAEIIPITHNFCENPFFPYAKATLTAAIRRVAAL